MTQPEATYDLLLQGGHVIDPKNGTDGNMDVAIRGGKIAAVDRDIPAAGASKVADVSGLYVTPGLVDLHTHSYGYFAWTFPDEYAFPNGITTVVDAGGAGYNCFEEFKRTIIDKARARLLVLLNIVASGMSGPEEQDTSELQALPCSEVINANKDVIVGVKTAHYRGQGWEAVDGAVEAAERSDTVVMVDYHNHPERSYRELILEHMRPGDMHTHMYAQHLAQIDDDNKVYDYVWEARKRGVLFDLGHGAGSFWFRIAKPCIEQGHIPDTISTDVHKGSIFLPRATMPMCMSKLMNLGLSFKDVVEKSTVAPARNIGRPELGTLSVGAEADVAAFELEEGDFGFVDSGIARMRGTKRLTCHMTVRSGEVVWDLNGLTMPNWETLGKYIRADRPGDPGSLLREHPIA